MVNIMSHLPDVILLGNPILRKRSQEIAASEFGTNNLKIMEEELYNVMQLEKGIGLASPQVGINKRAIVFGFKQQRAAEEIPYTFLINPSFEPLSETLEEDYEGCLSVGELRAKVSRFKHIGYKGYDRFGNKIEREVHGLHARVVQHEIDHLNGIIFLDRVTNFNSLGFHDELLQSGDL